jgi:uncharacterized protein (DUF736 family)
MENKKSNDIGAIWVKSGQYGDYLSISIEINGVKHNFSAFPNKYKEQGDKKPDYRIPAPKAKPTFEDALEERIKLVQEYQAKAKTLPAQKPLIDITETDIPF